MFETIDGTVSALNDLAGMKIFGQIISIKPCSKAKYEEFIKHSKVSRNKFASPNNRSARDSKTPDRISPDRSRRSPGRPRRSPLRARRSPPLKSRHSPDRYRAPRSPSRENSSRRSRSPRRPRSPRHLDRDRHRSPVRQTSRSGREDPKPTKVDSRSNSTDIKSDKPNILPTEQQQLTPTIQKQEGTRYAASWLFSMFFNASLIGWFTGAFLVNLL